MIIFFLLYLPPTATLVKAPSCLQLLHYFWLLAGNPAHLPSSLIVYSTFRSHFRLVFKGVGSCHPSAQDPPTAPASLGEASRVLTTIHVTWRSRPHPHPSPSLPDLFCCPPPGPLISRRIGALKHPGRTRPRHRRLFHSPCLEPLSSRLFCVTCSLSSYKSLLNCQLLAWPSLITFFNIATRPLP